jgi:alpha-L-rhamnosidase
VAQKSPLKGHLTVKATASPLLSAQAGYRRGCTSWQIARSFPLANRTRWGQTRLVPENAAHSLRVEHLVEPEGLTVQRPRFSWQLPEGATIQRAYQIHATKWDSGRVDSSQQLFVRYDPADSPALSSDELVSWRVKVWTDLGEHDFSDFSFFSLGIVTCPTPYWNWMAKWIHPDENEVASAGERPVYVLSSTVAPFFPVHRARLSITARGIYEVFIDGQRVGDLELTPGYTSSAERLQVQCFDVTDQFSEPGQHSIDVLLSDGWHRGLVGFVRNHDAYGNRTGVLLQMHVYSADAEEIFATGIDDWTSRLSHITRADLIMGETHDLTAGPFPTTPAIVSEPANPNVLVGSPSPPVRRIEELQPVSITTIAPSHDVVDFGQNINGWARLLRLGPRGTTTELAYGEALDPVTGDLTTDHLRPTDLMTGEPKPFGQVDSVISRGVAADVFEPRHSTKGFRYVRVTGQEAQLNPDDITAVVVHSDLQRRGWFTCSDERVNRLHEAAVWSLRSNMCDIPTDCPQRERAGWTGDWQLFVPTAAFLYDVGGFSTKWLADLANDQRADGAVPWFIPNPIPPETTLAGLSPYGSAGWGDAAVIVPWEVYLATGDLGLVDEQFASAKAWVEYAIEQARVGRGRKRAKDRPVAAPHEKFLWDSGFHFGEWLEPGEWNANPIGKALRTDPGPTATAYLHRSAYLLSRMADLLDHGADAERYTLVADQAKSAWQTEFIDADGAVTPLTQANLVRGLAFGLIPATHTDQAVADLVGLIRRADTHLGTGFLATPLLLPVLAEHGQLALAYELLFQDTSPSWMAMLTRGATTVWEDWDGVDEHDVPSASLNHYSKGAVISFLHQHVGGLRLDDQQPAYRHFTVEPRPGGGITSAETIHESPYGRIEVSWRVVGEQLSVDVLVPPGTTADITLPSGLHRAVSAGRHNIAG